MPAPESEKKKALILENVAAIGKGYEEVLAADYRYGSSNPSGMAVRAAVAEMAFEDLGSFARQMMVRVMGREGNLDDAEYISILLNSTHMQRFNYPTKRFSQYGRRQHSADADESVREAAIWAIAQVASRASSRGGNPPVQGGLGIALVGCALLDNSERIRSAAAEIVWNYADKATISLLLKQLSDAEKEGNEAIFIRAEEAVKRAAEAMGKARVRGTVLGPLLNTALMEGRAAAVAAALLAQLAGIEREVLDYVERKKLAMERSAEASGKWKKEEARKIADLIGRMREAGQGKEKLPLPRQLKGPPLPKQEGIRNAAPSSPEDGEPPRIPKGPVIEFFRRIACRAMGRKG
ncbi:MAG: hypothetical protein QXH30_02515 [Candidatus Bilamarchaeaceae archaeon]